MKKTSVYLSLISLCFFLTTSFVFGQNSSFDNANNKLKELEAKQATASAASSSQERQNVTSIFIEGTVSSLKTNSFYLKTDIGESFITTDDSTNFIQIQNKTKKLIGFGDLKIGEDLIILGAEKNSASANAKIVVRNLDKQSATFAQIGKISSVSDKILMLEPFSNTSPLSVFNLSPQTQIVTEKNSTLKISELSPEDKIIASGTIDDKGNLNLTNVLRINPSETPTSTPSAQ